MNNKMFVVGILVMVLTLGLVLVGCVTPTNTSKGTGADALTMSDYLKSIQPKSEDWGNRLVTVYQLNPEQKDEIITAFSNENLPVIDTYTRDWELSKTVFRYIELVELKNGINFCPKILEYSASDSNIVTQYLGEPSIGDIGVTLDWASFGDVSVEYVGQPSEEPTNFVPADPNGFEKLYYPGYYRYTRSSDGKHLYVHMHKSVDGGVETYPGWVEW
jgi:hypothetical protein